MRPITRSVLICVAGCVCVECVYVHMGYTLSLVLDLGAWSCGGLTSVRLLDSATPNISHHHSDALSSFRDFRLIA